MAGESTAGRAVRTAVERAGRGKNPVVRKKPAAQGSRQRSGRAPAPPVGERSAGRNRARSVVHRPRRNDQPRDLPARYRCVFYDQRGHGRSGRPRNHDYSLQALAGDLKAVLDWTGEERVVVVAHSMGGIAALQFAEQFPGELGGRVAGLVLVGSTYLDTVRGMTAAVSAWGSAWAQRSLITGAFRFMGQDPVRAQQLRRRGSDLGYLGTRLFGFGSNPSPSQVAFIDQILAGTDVEVWAKVFPSLIDFDLSESLEAVSVPALIATGDKDRLTPPAASRYMAHKIPGSRLLILEDAGHCAFLEKHEVLDAELAAFAG